MYLQKTTPWLIKYSFLLLGEGTVSSHSVAREYKGFENFHEHRGEEEIPIRNFIMDLKSGGLTANHDSEPNPSTEMLEAGDGDTWASDAGYIISFTGLSRCWNWEELFDVVRGSLISLLRPRQYLIYMVIKFLYKIFGNMSNFVRCFYMVSGISNPTVNEYVRQPIGKIARLISRN